SYCPDNGMSQPLPCPPGWSSTPGQISCHSCNDTSFLCAGAVAARWSQPVHRSTQPIACRPGTYNDREESACVVCPVGHYCVGGVALPCPAGTYGAIEGLQRLRDCTICPAGFYCLEGSSQRPISQFLCPQGYYCEEGTATPHGSPCPAGTAGEQLGQTSRAACKRCGEGRFCPAGVKDCLKCPAGFYCPEGRSDPVPCPPGSFNPLEGQDELADCRECYAGKACTQVALKAPDVDCMQGFVCPPGSSKPNEPTNACPPGTVSNRTDLTDRSQCQQCPARYACLRGTGGIQRPPLSCFAGHYCPPGTMFPTQYKCPVGTWNSRSGLKAESECRPCPQGWYCLAGSGAPSGRCSSGHYCPEGTAYGTQFPCPAGTYSLRMGNRHRDDCLICPEGSFCQQGTSKPSPCPPSTFRHLKGGQRLEDCSTCPAGYFCPLSATVNPRVCGAGSYSDEGSVECSPCLQGHYCSNETTSEEAMLSVMVCPAGFLCSQGLARDPQRSATLCPRGFYCPGGGIDPNPIPCPNGTYSEFPGLRDISECVQCPEGKYCYSEQPEEQSLIRPTGICPDGHYCPTGTGDPYTHPCQAGRYRNNTLGHSGEACVLCPSRYYCAILGTGTPLVCPEGFYCPEGISAPEPCPEGTFSSRSALSDRSECSSCGGGQYCNSVGLTEPSGSCREGFYCRGRATSATPVDGPTGGLCPAGSYCPLASVTPRPCPPGTFSNSTGLIGPEECVICPPGVLTLTSLVVMLCSTVGRVRLVGSAAESVSLVLRVSVIQDTTAPLEPPLLLRPTLFNIIVEIKAKMIKLVYDNQIITATLLQVAVAFGGMCPAGYVCPQGTKHPQQQPCPAGTWSNTVGAENLSSCMPCPPGHYCSSTGLNQPTGICDAGYYCSGGAMSPIPSDGVTGDICPVGHYCPMGSASPVLCPDGTYSNTTGFYCEDWGLFEPTGPCQAGYYCIAGVNFQNPDGNFSTGIGGACPKGSYCPEGNTLPLPCPPGTYSNSLHLTDVSECIPCPAGHFCGTAGLTHPSGLCEARFYCSGGDKTATGSEGGHCPPAHYCPEGSSSPVPCPAGTYTNLTGQFMCSRCPAGYYCPEKTGNFFMFPCPPGFYCPDGTRHATQFPCPRGYYNPEPMTQSLDSCLPCPPGHFCEKERLTKVSGKCKAGWFCVSAAWNSQPFDLDNYTNANCLCPATSTGGRCQVGFYCPLGSSEPLPCLPGTFCNISGLALPMGPCSPGFYCVGGATKARPTDEETGNICPSGTYCDEGSAEPELCPAGTFSPVPGQTSEAGCQPCIAGFYCEGAGLRAPTGPCSQGYWCPPGQATATALPCPAGHFCPQGSAAPKPCPPGTYQHREKQEACTVCEAGYYCELRLGLANASLLRPCPTGHYCPAGTALPDQHPCPIGTFNPRRRTHSPAGCMPCAAGQYCPSVGLSEPAGPCNAGHWCREGASSPSPLDGISGSLCPPGQYCPSGTTAPLACPQGTWSNSSGVHRQEDCTPCPGGFYCDSAALTKPRGPCSEGYYCVEGAVTSTPTDRITGGPCPEGYFCPEGTVNAMPCEPGTYVAVTHATRCEPCEAGWYCVSGTLHLCPAGFYCPEGTGFDLRACPEGTYDPDPGSWSVSQCRQCDGGHYCSSRNGTAVTGPCQEGYYCSHGNTSPRPVLQAAGIGGPCPVGHYCPQATIHPLPCPRGTFSNLTKLISQENCQPCLPGYYCNTMGLSAPSGECLEGFFCLGGADRPDPPLRDSHGGPCPKGYYCSEGSVTPQLCPQGTISKEDGRASCSACPQGFYCSGSGNGSSSESDECPVGHYCPSGTWSKHQYPCPPGSINPHTRMTTHQDCLPCPPGFFCASSGKGVVSGQCSAGYYCISGARLSTPEDGGITGDRCPEGHYCPQGSSVPLPCPIGYYSNNTGNVHVSSCLPCPPGFLCVTRGLSSPSHICPAGSYCPGRNDSSRQASLPCSPGNMCPPGTDRQVPCLPGTYQDLPGQAECVKCPAGFYCPGLVNDDTGDVSGTQTPTLCPKGHYCPAGTQSGVLFPCPAGAFSRQMGLSNKSGCELCSPGRYCSSPGLASPTGVCSPGYICVHGSVSAQPVEGTTGGRCSAGFYCPQGTSYMVPCPAGTFSSVQGAVSIEACQPCLSGHYCAKVGLSSPCGLCNPGFYCTEGSMTATPRGNITVSGDLTAPAPLPANSVVGQFHGDVCPAGHYCPRGSAKPSPCPPGTFLGKSAAESEADCDACYPGSFCPSWAQISAELLCPPGWFCPPRSVSGRQPGYQCPPGYACPYGSAIPSICSPGTFQASPGQSTCNICPPGFYCMEGSTEPLPCPVGHFSSSAGRKSPSDCYPCPPGSFCSGSALTEPSGLCQPGHFCSLGSTESSPVSQPHGDVCPMGHFCHQGSGSPKPCPIGSFLPEPGSPSPSHCRPCPPGKYCLSPGALQPTGLCFAGFFCSGGADSPSPRANSSLFGCLHEILGAFTMKTDTAAWAHNLSFFNNSRHAGSIEVETGPQADSDHTGARSLPCVKSAQYACSTYRGDVCPEGFFCPLGSAFPQLCEAGSYCNQTGLDAPVGPCVAGYYCPKGSVGPHDTPCPTGHYCPLGAPLPVPCPLGTFKGSLGGSTVEACQVCLPGHYCHQSGKAEPSGQCAEGYYCPEGQSSAKPQHHMCSEGHYCEKGSVRQTACLPGSYQLRQGQSKCEACPPGFYCHHQGMTHPALCERGFYCPSGSANQLPCPAGTYGNTSGLLEEWQCSTCDPGMYCKGTGRTFPSGLCAAGFICVGRASEASPSDKLTGYPCPPGFYCSVGTSVPKPCPKGTFSEQSGLVDEAQCRRCSAGSFCSETGLSAVSGPCLSGFYCLEGSHSPSPVLSESGSVCPAGHYCEEGCSVPTPCPAGSYQNETGGKGKDDCKQCLLGWFQNLLGQKECNLCPPGFDCTSPTKERATGVSIPLLCPAGYICPGENPGHQSIPCPKGTYSPNQGLSAIVLKLKLLLCVCAGECLVCPAGQFCGSEGLVEPSGPCAAGFLCLMGSTVSNPTDNITGSLCPPGIFCEEGQKAGDCWAGFYCGWGSSRADQALCPAGFFCPSRTPAPVPCPAGTFSSAQGKTHQDNCTTCTPGYYCHDEGTVRPALCPRGYYCPPGLILGLEFPCPPGTVQSQLGASGPDACLACPAGMFCSQSGLSQPTGLCEAGYYCPAGSSSPNSTEGNSTRSHLCPSGHYCPSGTGYPLPCPTGSLSISLGLSEVGECPPCPPGLFCDKPAITDFSDALPCHAGYVCLGGSSSPIPSNGFHGYLCPAGHSCTVGSASEVPCEPGTYSPAPGAAHCTICPQGTMCPSSATQEPSVCPSGHFCPAGTALPQPCPPGTFNNQTGAQSLSVCTPCPSGVYCSSYGASIPQGPCLQGYFCQGGAAGPTPQNSDNITFNGPCPVGHYCPAGCLSPVPCPLGSIRNTAGGVSIEGCFACPAGHYCSTEGLDKPSGPCAAGFYCPYDFSSTTPYAFLCPKGHYCLEGSALALPCPTGEYQPNPGSDSCSPCRPGFYCEEAVVGEPWPCPPHSFCPAGTMVPQPCPKGTYTLPNQGGLQDKHECLSCPSGLFCRSGRIQSKCAAGYLCVSGSADFTPQGPVYNLTQCQWGMQCAGPCPPGFYCPEGTETPQVCPANTVRSSPGGASLQDCLPCPPKYWCKPGDPVLHPCPAGHYCDGLFDSNFSDGPKPCPLYTYQASPGAGSKGDCLPCPPGSHCNSTGLRDFSNSLCPPGYWCSGSAPPIYCPAGAKRSHPGAATPTQCEPCAGGTYCPDPRATGTPNVEGLPCRASYQCPIGAVSEMLCRAGSYCGPQTADPQVCPEGYFCPEGSHSYNTPKQLCPFPYYCPANCSAMKSCEGGLMPVNTSGLRGSKNSCCSVCEGGTYRHHLSPVPQCLPCPAGYFCPPGSDHYKSNHCPFGYVCPIGSSEAIPCPPGFFGNLTRGKTLSDCFPCPADTFNHLSAQRACFPCGSSSTSPAGSSTCTCIGKNRAFQHSDGSCLCRTGFIFYNELDFKSSTTDSELDCQPEVNTRCATGQVRLAASRECVYPSLYSCNITCGPLGGTLDVEMGICHCEGYVSAEELCNTSCLSRLPQLTAQLSPDGNLLLSLKERNSMIWARTVKDVLGPDIHARNFGKIHLVQFGSKGVFGWIPTQKELINHFLSEPTELLNTRPRKRRHTGDDGDDDDDDDGGITAVLPRIPNPIACLSSGDLLIFHLTINHTDRHLSHFPVYKQDHLFNSNPSWDFGAFRHLQILMRQTHFNSTRFAHVFSETGKYVFVDSAVPEWSMVVVVSEEGTCDPRTSVFQPMTPAQLVRFGIIKQHRLNLLPNWGVIVGVLILLLVVVVVLTTTMLVLRPSKAKLIFHWKMKPKWRSLGEPFCPVECVCSGDSIAVPRLGGVLGSRSVGEGAEAEEPAILRGGSISGRIDLEEFNVKTLYDKLEDQNLHIASQLARHRKDTQEFFRNICHQTETLKNVFENMDHKKLSLLKELLVHNAMRDKPSRSRAEERDTKAEASTVLLESVLRSVEALLCRLTGEVWQSQDLTGFPCGRTGHQDARECEPQAGYTQPCDTNMCYTQFSLMNINKEEALLPEPVQQSAGPCLSDHDLSKLVSISPLFKTLQEIQQSLQCIASAKRSQHLDNASEQCVQENYDGQLIPTALDNLSPQHAAVFLFGCQVMQLLENCSLFPPVLLLLAKSVPVSSSSCNEAMLAHCSGDFYFDETNQILYLSEAKLQHVGHFIAIILQSMAHIVSESKPHIFMQALHEAVSALSLYLFNLSFKWSTEESNCNAMECQHSTLVKEFLSIRVPTEPHFTEHLLARRLEKYKYFKLQQLISIQRSSAEDTHTGLPPRGTPTQRATPKGMPSLSRNGTILLELKRHYLSQRLNELQSTLRQIRQRPQNGSESMTGQEAVSKRHVSTGREYSPGKSGRSSTDGQQTDGVLASQSQSEGLGASQLESHISDHQSGLGLINNPETSLDCQMLESPGHLHTNVAEKEELNSQITIDNTTDTDNILKN
ncbi:SCO-spondin-like isoform X1, partial [Solea senegalensis]